jgi:hypothetical protein
MTNTIFPVLLGRLLETIPLTVLMNTRDAGLPIALLWAVGGGVVGWLGGPRTGAAIIGLCGLITGYWLSAVAAGGDLSLITWSSLVGLLYGVPGGLIMGRVFPKPAME